MTLHTASWSYGVYRSGFTLVHGWCFCKACGGSEGFRTGRVACWREDDKRSLCSGPLCGHLWSTHCTTWVCVEPSLPNTKHIHNIYIIHNNAPVIHSYVWLEISFYVVKRRNSIDWLVGLFFDNVLSGHCDTSRPSCFCNKHRLRCFEVCSNVFSPVPRLHRSPNCFMWFHCIFISL